MSCSIKSLPGWIAYAAVAIVSFRGNQLSASTMIPRFFMAAVWLMVVSIQTATVQAEVAIQDDSATAQSADEEQPVSDQERSEDSLTVIRGRVINEAGEPVAGAKVFVLIQVLPYRSLEATTDEAGKFELSHPADWQNGRLRRGLLGLWAYAPGYSLQSQSVRTGKTENTITLPPEASQPASFRILSPDGQPLANVLVQPRQYSESSALQGTFSAFPIVPKEIQPFVSGRTDANGFVSLPAVDASRLLIVEMVTEEFGMQTMGSGPEVSIPEDGIRLRAAGTIKGQLVAEDPELVRGVPLELTMYNQNWGEPQGVAEVFTDSDGRFEIPAMASGGPLRTFVFIDPELPVLPLLNDNVYLIAGETMELEIPLVAPTVVHGQVVAKETGEPVAGVGITLRYRGTQQFETVTTDENGLYRARVLPGRLRASITRVPGDFARPEEKVFRVPADVDSFELPTIEVASTRKISGRLIDGSGQPLPNIHVMAMEGNQLHGSDDSDAEGNFAIGVPDGIKPEFRVVADGPGAKPVTVVQTDPLIIRYTADTERKEMEAERARKPDVALTGRVLMGGEPVSGVDITLYRNTPVSREQPNTSRTEKVSSTVTDSDGNYRVTGLKAGDRYYFELKPPVTAADPTWQYQMPYIQTLPDDAQGDVTLPDVNLLNLSQSLAGVVVDPDGNPVQGARVSAQLQSGGNLGRITPSGPPPWTESDQQGRFQLKQLPDVPLAIMAFIRPRVGNTIRFPAKLNVDMNQQDIRIVLDPSLQEEEE